MCTLTTVTAPVGPVAFSCPGWHDRRASRARRPARAAVAGPGPDRRPARGRSRAGPPRPRGWVGLSGDRLRGRRRGGRRPRREHQPDGYQEVCTDPSYAGQVVVMTYPLIGNYGRIDADDQSEVLAARPRGRQRHGRGGRAGGQLAPSSATKASRPSRASTRGPSPATCEPTAACGRSSPPRARWTGPPPSSARARSRAGRTWTSWGPSRQPSRSTWATRWRSLRRRWSPSSTSASRPTSFAASVAGACGSGAPPHRRPGGRPGPGDRGVVLSPARAIPRASPAGRPGPSGDRRRPPAAGICLGTSSSASRRGRRRPPALRPPRGEPPVRDAGSGLVRSRPRTTRSPSTRPRCPRRAASSQPGQPQRRVGGGTAAPDAADRDRPVPPRGSTRALDALAVFDRFVAAARVWADPVRDAPPAPAGAAPARPVRPASALIIGSGPVVIGQAAEFDYAGTQACRALRAEGVRTILVNSNPATIMTDRPWRTRLPRAADGAGDRGGDRPREAGWAAGRAGRPDRPQPGDGPRPGRRPGAARRPPPGHPPPGDRDGRGSPGIPRPPRSARPAVRAVGDRRRRLGGRPDGQRRRRPRCDRAAGDRPAGLHPGGTGGARGDGGRYRERVRAGLRASPIGQVMVEKVLVGWQEIESR